MSAARTMWLLEQAASVRPRGKRNDVRRRRSLYPMATLATKSEVASRAVDSSYSGRGNFETCDGRKVKAAALPEVCSGERPFPSIVLK